MDTTEKVEMGMSQGDTTEVLPLKSETNNGVQNMTFIEKIKYVKSNITVEPVLALFVIPSVLAMLATQNLNLDKACRVNLGFGDEVCTALRLRRRANHTYEEDEVQKLIASVQAWKSVVQTSLPTLLMLFLGAWSDKTGRRKICMLMPIFGEFMTCVLNITSTFFFQQIPVELTVFLEVIFPSLTGGWYAMFLGCFSYLGDITSRETRTFRIGILNLCMTIGFPIGMGLSGVLLKILGYYGVFGIAATLQLLNFCYVYFTLEDHRWLESKDKKKQPGLTGHLLEFFDKNSLKETLQIAFKKGDNNRRLRICLVLIVVCLYFGPMWGELSVMYIFARYRFNWDEVKYSIYSTYSLITHSIGTLFCISVFSKKMRADDAVLGMISAASKICGALVLAFARNDVEVYMCPLVEILNGTTSIALRSIASKLVSYQELGKVFSLFGVAETMMPLIFTPLYSKVYIAALHVLPGAVFLLSVLATIPVFFIFGWFYHQHKKDDRKRRLEIPNPPEPMDNKTKVNGTLATMETKMKTPTLKTQTIPNESTKSGLPHIKADDIDTCSFAPKEEPQVKITSTLTLTEAKNLSPSTSTKTKDNSESAPNDVKAIGTEPSATNCEQTVDIMSSQPLVEEQTIILSFSVPEENKPTDEIAQTEAKANKIDSLASDNEAKVETNSALASSEAKSTNSPESDPLETKNIEASKEIATKSDNA